MMMRSFAIKGAFALLSLIFLQCRPSFAQTNAQGVDYSANQFTYEMAKTAFAQGRAPMVSELEGSWFYSAYAVNPQLGSEYEYLNFYTAKATNEHNTFWRISTSGQLDAVGRKIVSISKVNTKDNQTTEVNGPLILVMSSFKGAQYSTPTTDTECSTARSCKLFGSENYLLCQFYITDHRSICSKYLIDQVNGYELLKRTK